MKVNKLTKEKVKEVVLATLRPEAGVSGGEVELDTICNLLPEMKRWEVVAALKHITGGVFITGRRGLKSRFAFGKQSHTEVRTHHNHNGNGAAVTLDRRLPIHDLGLRVDIAGTKLVIPVRVLGLTKAA